MLFKILFKIIFYIILNRPSSILSNLRPEIMARKDYEDIDLLTFQAKFRNETDCWDWLIKTRYPEGYKCPLCGSREYYFKKKKTLVDMVPLGKSWS